MWNNKDNTDELILAELRENKEKLREKKEQIHILNEQLRKLERSRWGRPLGGA